MLFPTIVMKILPVILSNLKNIPVLLDDSVNAINFVMQLFLLAVQTILDI